MASSQLGDSVHKVSKDIVNQLAVVLRTAHIHDASNVAVMSAAQRLLATINPAISAEGAITIEVVGEYFYVNDSRVRFSMEFLLNFEFLIKEMKKRSLGSITFLGEVRVEDIQVFIREFVASAYSSDPLQAVTEGLRAVQSIDVGKLRQVKEDAEEFDIRKTVKKTYFNAVSFTSGVMKKLKSGEKINMKRAKRVVESMVDSLLQQEDLMLGMTAIKSYDDYTYHHSVNVSILSVALGQRLGLNKKTLMELGLVALFHDIGKMEIPTEVLNKPSNFTDEEWKLMKKHPIWGVRAILNMKGFDATSVRSAIVAYEHHIHGDRSGYPAIRKLPLLDLYSRIVGIADQYDGMTSSRVYARVPMTADKALSLMMERIGNQLDPLIIKFFVNMVGMYPVGTLIVLDTKELALVYGSNSAFPNRPRVMIITDNQGNKVEGSVIDLSEQAPDGRYVRNIAKTLDPNKYRINLAEYML